MKDVILAAVPPGVLLSIPHPIRFSDEYVSLFSPDWQLGGGTGGGTGGTDARLRLLSGLAWRIAEAAVCVRRLRSRWQKWARTAAATGAMLARAEVSCGEDRGGTRLLSPPPATAVEEEEVEVDASAKEGRGDAKAAALRRAIAWRREEVAAAIEAEEEAGDFFIDVQLPAVAAAVQTTASAYDARVDEIGRVRGPLLTLAAERHVQTLQTIAGEAPGAAPEETEGAPPSPAAAAAAAAEAWIRSASLAAEVALGTIGEAMVVITTSPLPGITASPFSSSSFSQEVVEVIEEGEEGVDKVGSPTGVVVRPPLRPSEKVTAVHVTEVEDDGREATFEDEEALAAPAAVEVRERMSTRMPREMKAVNRRSRSPEEGGARHHLPPLKTVEAVVPPDDAVYDDRGMSDEEAQVTSERSRGTAEERTRKGPARLLQSRKERNPRRRDRGGDGNQEANAAGVLEAATDGSRGGDSFLVSSRLDVGNLASLPLSSAFHVTEVTKARALSANRNSQIDAKLSPAGRMASVTSQPGDTTRPSKMEFSEGTSNRSGTGVIIGYPQKTSQTELKSARLNFKKKRNGVGNSTPGESMAASTTTGSGKSGVPADWKIQPNPYSLLTMGNPRPGSQKGTTTADRMSLVAFARENWDEITKTIQARKSPSPSRP